MKLPLDHLSLDRSLIIGPLISRWELEKFKNCWNERFSTSKILKLLHQQFSNLLISQGDMNGPRLGALSINRWSGGTTSDQSRDQVSETEGAWEDVSVLGNARRTRTAQPTTVNVRSSWPSILTSFAYRKKKSSKPATIRAVHLGLIRLKSKVWWIRVHSSFTDLAKSLEDSHSNQRVHRIPRSNRSKKSEQSRGKTTESYHPLRPSPLDENTARYLRHDISPKEGPQD